MKKYFAFVFCFLLISCSKRKIEPPLFLDFYPSLSNKEFEDKISELSKIGVLQNGYYNILIDQYKIPFSIGKSDGTNLPKFISLQHNEFFNHKNQLTEMIKSNFDSKIIGTVEILKKNYPMDFKFKNLNDFQTKKVLNNYNDFFYYIDVTNDNYDYMVFRDTLKTIVLSYSQLRNINLKSKESMLTINIGYYYNRDFDSILNDHIFFKKNEKKLKVEEKIEKFKKIRLEQEKFKKNNDKL